MEAFRTTNKMYGESWNCTGSNVPLKEEVPSYAEIGAREVELKNTMSQYKQNKLNSLKDLSKELEEV